MVDNRRRKSLYEVIGKTWPKSGYSKVLEPLRPEKSNKNEPVTTDSTTQVPEKPTKWPRRPKFVQFSANKIEISMPYQTAVVLLLGAVLLVLVVFRFGQNISNQKVSDLATKISKNVQEKAGRTTVGGPQTSSAEKTAPVSTSAEKVEPAKLKANNRIVIQTYQLRVHLEPVKDYFARFGIETKIEKIDNWYYLVTRNKYENPEKPGTDGYSVKQKIIELGAKYKAPPGYETFGTKPFHDAYGKKFDD